MTPDQEYRLELSVVVHSRHRRLNSCPRGVATGPQMKRLKISSWRPLKNLSPLPFGQIVSTSPTSHTQLFHRSMAENFCGPVADLELLRTVGAIVDFNAARTSWIVECACVHHKLVLGIHLALTAGSPVEAVTEVDLYRAWHDFGDPCAVEWLGKLGASHSKSAYFGRNQLDQGQQLITLLTLTTVSACSFPWRSSLSQYVVYDPSRDTARTLLVLAWGPRLVLEKKALKAHWKMGRAQIVSFGGLVGVEVSPTLSFCGVLVIMIITIWGCVELQALENIRRRWSNSYDASALADAILEIDEANRGMDRTTWRQSRARKGPRFCGSRPLGLSARIVGVDSAQEWLQLLFLHQQLPADPSVIHRQTRNMSS